MKLIKNYLYNLSYQFFIILIPIILVPYISRTLGPDAIGMNAYTNSIVTYFILLANLGLSLYGNRTIAYFRNDTDMRSKKFWEIAFFKMLMMLLSLLVFIIFCLIYKQYIILLFAQSVQLIAVGFDISWFFVGIEDFKKTVTRNVVVRGLSLICIFLFVKDSSDLVLYILINGFSALFGNFTLWTYIKKYVTKSTVKIQDLKPHIRPVFFLFLPQLATSMFLTINRLLLGNLSTLTQTGYFDNTDKVVRVFLTFIIAIGTVAFPRIANYYKEGKHKEAEKLVRYAINLVSMVSFPISFGIFLVAKPFSNIFFGNQFDGIYIVLSILSFELIFMGWSSIIGQQYLVAINKVSGLTISMVISIMLSTIGSVILIPKYGAAGAAAMSVFAEIIIIVIQLYYTKDLLNLKLIFSEVWEFLLSAILMVTICSLFNRILLPFPDLINLVVQVIIGALCYTVALLFLKPKVVMETVKYVKGRKK